MIKEVVGYVQDVVGENTFLVQFEYDKKKYTSSISLSYLCSKEEVCLEIYDPISDLHQTEQGELLTIDGDPVVGQGYMFERGVYFFVFYCL